MPEPLSEIQNSSSPRERVSVTHTCVAPPCRTALAVASEMICEISCTIQQGTSMSGGSRTRSIWQSHSFRRKATKCDSSGESVFLDRKDVVEGKDGAGGVDTGGRRII